MITGKVNLRLEAIIEMRVRSTDGGEVNLNGIVDTGFSEYLTLPAALVETLSLASLTGARVRLADGSLHDVEVVQGNVWWEDEWRRIPVQVSDGDPLIGMALLRDHVLTIEIIEAGEVSIEPRS